MAVLIEYCEFRILSADFLKFEIQLMKNTRKILGYNILTIMILCTSSCYYDEFVENVPIDSAVSFTADIQPIFSANCTSCHPILVSSPDLTEGNSYSSITKGIYIVANDAEASVLYQRLLGNPRIMPPSGSLPASEIDLIRIWIEQGAPDN